MNKRNISIIIICLVFGINLPLLHAQTVSEPFLRLSGLDRWEGITHATGDGGYSSYSYSSWEVSDSMLIDSIMFYKRGLIYYGFDSDSNKLYEYSDGVKRLSLHFGLPSGSSFIGGFGNGTPITVTGNSSSKVFKAHYGFYPVYDVTVTYAKETGVISDVSQMVMSSRWSTFSTSTLSKLGRKVNGDTLYLDHGYFPSMIFTPVTSPSTTWSPTFSTANWHYLNYRLQPNNPQFNYLDTLFFEYYYSNGVDSTDIITLKYKASSSNSFVVTFDSSIIRSGYHVRYWLKLKDKSFRPKFIKNPEYQSYHTLTFNVPVGIVNDAVPDNFFQVAAYPNPFNNSTSLQIDHFESGEVTVNIYSLTGEKAVETVLIRKEIGTLLLPIEFRSQPSGVYIADVNFISSSGKMHRKQQKLIYLK